MYGELCNCIFPVLKHYAKTLLMKLCLFCTTSNGCSLIRPQLSSFNLSGNTREEIVQGFSQSFPLICEDCCQLSPFLTCSKPVAGTPPPSSHGRIKRNWGKKEGGLSPCCLTLGAPTLLFPASLVDDFP